MKSCASDIKFLLGLISAHILFYITYQNTSVFWYLYTATILFCMCFAITIEKKSGQDQSTFISLIYGLVTGVVLYGVFALGDNLFQNLGLSGLTKDVSSIYSKLGPEMFWHFLVLFIIIIPGEEIFWRGFVQRKLSERLDVKWTIITSAILYTLPAIYADNTALLIASLVAGLAWAALYQWKKSLLLVVSSHIIFNLLLMVIFPLR